MKILFIAPFPPPIHGQSLATEIFFQEVNKTNEVEVINTNKRSHKEGFSNFGRIIEIFQIYIQIVKKNKRTDIIYFQISESLAGNLKDLIIYILCFRRLSVMFIHLHGGSIKKLLFDLYPLLTRINKFFLSKLAGAIILGESHIEIFSDFMAMNKIHIVPNFAENYLFITEEKISLKFQNTTPLIILYISNLIPGKGYMELLYAFIYSDESIKANIQIDFAGGFETEVEKEFFLNKIEPYHQIKYHGIVNGIEKKELFNNAHIFCLPTSYLEGQPISILEAYASGCVVITTNKGGIQDVFEDQVNGFEIGEKSLEAIKRTIKYTSDNIIKLLPIAIKNRNIAQEKYRTITYVESLKKTIGAI